MKESTLSKHLKQLISDADKLVQDIRTGANKLRMTLNELKKKAKEENETNQKGT